MQYVTISRYWNNPQIKIEITEEEIELKIHIDDFKEAVAYLDKKIGVK